MYLIFLLRASAVSGVLTTSRQTVLITGGSTGLGLNAARQLAEKGASVIIAARNVENLEKGIAYIKVKLHEVPLFFFFFFNLAGECRR